MNGSERNASEESDASSAAPNAADDASKNDRVRTGMRSPVDVALLGLAALIIVGIAWMGWRDRSVAARDIVDPVAPTPTRPAAATPASALDAPAAFGDAIDMAAVQTVTDYIIASAIAAERRDVNLMRPFVDEASTMWRSITDEYARRDRTGERRIAVMNRLRIERAIADGDDIIVQTLEDWHVRVYAHNRADAFRYVGRFQYRVSRIDGQWKVRETREMPVLVETTE